MGVAGPFSIAKYESSEGTFVYKIKVQPETIAASFGSTSNAEPSGARTPFLPSAVISRSRRSIGVHPRTVSVKVTATGVSAANAVNSIIQIPILSKATYAAIVEGAVGVYQGDTIVVVTRHPENIV